MGHCAIKRCRELLNRDVWIDAARKSSEVEDERDAQNSNAWTWTSKAMRRRKAKIGSHDVCSWTLKPW